MKRRTIGGLIFGSMILLAIGACDSASSTDSSTKNGAANLSADASSVSDASDANVNTATADASSCSQDFVTDGGIGCEVNATQPTFCQVAADGTQTCRNACPSDKFGVTCKTIEHTNPPNPNPALNCDVIPGPMPPGVIAWCCSCGP